MFYRIRFANSTFASKLTPSDIKQRFVEVHDRYPEEQNGSSGSQQTQKEVDQRRLYVGPWDKTHLILTLHSHIHNLLPLTAVSLMATTPRCEASMVRDLLYLHLCRGTEVKVDIPVSPIPSSIPATRFICTIAY